MDLDAQITCLNQAPRMNSRNLEIPSIFGKLNTLNVL
jgi:hypothetical protein